MATPENNTKVTQNSTTRTAFGQRVSAHELRTEGEIANPSVADKMKNTGGHMFRNTKNTNRANDRVVAKVHQKPGY